MIGLEHESHGLRRTQRGDSSRGVCGLGRGTRISSASRAFGYVHAPCTSHEYADRSSQVIITLFPLLAPESPQLPAQPLANTTSLWPLAPALVLCSLFFSSTLFSESISASKYPAYKLYQQRVSMFVPFLTPLWGMWLSVLGKKEEADRKLFAKGGKAKMQ